MKGGLTGFCCLRPTPPEAHGEVPGLCGCGNMGQLQAPGAALLISNPDTLSCWLWTSVHLLNPYMTLLSCKMTSVIFTLKGGYEA